MNPFLQRRDRDLGNSNRSGAHRDDRHHNESQTCTNNPEYGFHSSDAARGR